MIPNDGSLSISDHEQFVASALVQQTKQITTAFQKALHLQRIHEETRRWKEVYSLSKGYDAASIEIQSKVRYGNEYYGV